MYATHSGRPSLSVTEAGIQRENRKNPFAHFTDAEVTSRYGTPNPEECARQTIDVLLEAGGWHICDASNSNTQRTRGVAFRDFSLSGHGFADYLLYDNGNAAGGVEMIGY